MRWITALIALAAAHGFGAPLGFAWTPIGSTWTGGTAEYYVQEDGSDDLGDASVALAREGLEVWQAVACTSFVAAYQGTTTTMPGSVEGQNVVGWIEEGWSRGSGVLGTTTTRFNASGIVESDIALNGEHWTWVTGDGSTRDRTCNAFSILAHEGGHFAGLGHSSDPNALMRASYPGGTLSLSADDEEGICTLYPSADPQPSCSETGCPQGQECINDTCVTPLEVLCAPCSSGEDCGGPSDACLSYPEGPAGCGIACSVDADCGGAPFACLRVRGTDQNQCVRRQDGTERCDEPGPPQDPPPPDEPTPPDPPLPAIGGDCQDASDCDSGVCVDMGEGGFCTRPCTAEDCPQGFQCRATGGISFCQPDATADPPGPVDPNPAPGPNEDGETSGCSATDPNPGTTFAWLLGLVVMVALRRSRSCPRA